MESGQVHDACVAYGSPWDRALPLRLTQLLLTQPRGQQVTAPVLGFLPLTGRPGLDSVQAFGKYTSGQEIHLSHPPRSLGEYRDFAQDWNFRASCWGEGPSSRTEGSGILCVSKQ